MHASPLGVAKNQIAPGSQRGVIPGIGLARTLPPSLPPNFLSRRSILADAAIDRYGLTLIAAPAGFGKTSLVAEFVSQIEFPVIWYTATDSDNTRELNAHFLQAIRNVEPDFAPQLDDELDNATHDFLAKLLAELGDIKKHFVIVVDNNRMNQLGDEKKLNRFLELMPPNAHAISLRRKIQPEVFSKMSSFTNFKMYGVNDLKFTASEIEKICELNGIAKDNPEAQKMIASAKGWPSAVSILATNIARGLKTKNFVYDGTFSVESLNLLLSELLKSFELDERTMLEKLSIVNNFSSEVAEVILESDYSITKLNSLANDGMFLLRTSEPDNNFAVNPLMRETFASISSIKNSERKEIHKRLSRYFQNLNQFVPALSHAKESGDPEQYRALFRNSMRNLIAIGRGKELLQMANIVGDNTVDGTLKRQTVELIGLAADFQYESALSLMQEMENAAEGGELENFIGKFVAAVQIYIYFAMGRTEELAKRLEIARSESGAKLDLGVADKISILRVMSAKESIYDNAEALRALRQDAREIAKSDKSPLVLHFIQAIEASVLLSEGEFKDALVVANNVILQAERNGYSGIFGPLDAMYVRARCLLEFAQTEESHLEFEKIRNLAASWRQYIWQYLAESFTAREYALTGQSAAALEIVRTERERIASFSLQNGLGNFADLTELFIRNSLQDWDRAGILLGRLPNFLLAERIKVIYNFAVGKKSEVFSAAKLPMENARDQIYKYLAEAEENVDSERLSLESMRKALVIGARVGAKETFLRQSSDSLNLIIKIAGEQPTVYLEELTSAITSRLKLRSENVKSLRASLTKRELEILHHLATGNPISAIVAILHVSQNTMKTHLKNIYRKLEASGRDDAVAKAKSLYIL